jgi:hypothetical protein
MINVKQLKSRAAFKAGQLHFTLAGDPVLSRTSLILPPAGAYTNYGAVSAKLNDYEPTAAPPLGLIRPKISVLDFGFGADSYASWEINPFPLSYLGEPLTIAIQWFVTPGVGDVLWRVAFARAQVGIDVNDVAFSAPITAAPATVGSPSEIVETELVVSNAAAGLVEAGDSAFMIIERVGSDAADSFLGTARVVGVNLSW